MLRAHLITILILTAATALRASSSPPSSITEELRLDSTEISLYDCWPSSPFRTGDISDFSPYISFTEVPLAAPNTSEPCTAPVLALRRSRLGSNTFGVRIPLDTPLCLGTQTRYVHVLLYKPVAETSTAMLLGLGKRQDWPAQRPETEQFWVTPLQPLVPGQWNDLVFPITTHETVAIHSLVVIPDLSSPHLRTSDFIVYISDIEINDSPERRVNP